MAFISASELFEKYKAASPACQCLLQAFTDFYQKRRQLLLWAALGILGTALFYASLLLGLSAGQAAAVVAAMAAAAAHAEPAEGSAPWLTAGAAALTAVLILLPAYGLRLTAATGISVAALALCCRRPDPSYGPVTRAPLWLTALLLAGVPAWIRCLSLLMGNSLYAAAGAFAAAAAAAAAAELLRPSLQNWLEDGPNEGLAIFASGVAGLIALAGLRFIGVNASGAEHLYFPMRGAGDVLFIGVQSCALFGLWLLPAALAQRARPRAPWRSVGVAMAAAAAGAALLPFLDPPRTALLAQAALAIAGLIAAGASRLWERPLARQVVGAALLTSLTAGWLARDLFRDVWLNRLDAAYPGGRYLVLTDDGRESLGVYQFSYGAKLLLRDGVARDTGGGAGRQVHAAMLLHPSPSKVLLLGVRSPKAIDAVSRHAVETDVVDAHPGAGAAVTALYEGGLWTPDPRAHFLKKPGDAYDLIFLDIPSPWGSPEAALLGTRQSFERLRRRLAPGGVAVVFLPAPHPIASEMRLLATAAAVFSRTVAFSLPSGLLVAGSDADLPEEGSLLKQRLQSYSSLNVLLEDPGLSEWLAQLPSTSAETLRRADRLPEPDTDDRVPSAFPLRELLTPLPPAPAP